MLIAENMNREGDHFMKDEYCYFDGKVKRCKNFVTLTASTYHPLLKRQVVLAVMEAEREDSENIELFWMLFNEALSQATGTKDTVFIPIGWCVDMAGANMNGLERVYGKEVLERVKSCEFHFKENRNKMAQKLKDNEEVQQFKELCDALLAARMVETYFSAKDSLESFIQNKPERSFLSSRVDWWHSRRQFIFRAFSPNEAAPRMNQAEVIHASWSHRDRSNLSLLDAAQADVRDSVMLEAELKAFKSGNTKGGSGPSYGERRKKSHQQEISRATQLGKEMSKLRGNLVDPSSGHRPPQEKAGKGKKGTSRSVPKRSNQPGPARQLRANASQTDTGQSQPHTFLSHPYTNHSQQCANPLQRYPNQSQQHASSSQQCAHPSQQYANLSQQYDNAASQYANPPQQYGNPPQQYSNQPQQYSNQPQQYGNPPQMSASPQSAFQFQQSNLWHSGLSPHPYELIVLPNNVRVCYGCGSLLKAEERSSPNNVVIRHFDRKFIRRDESMGQPVFSVDFKNTYYHLDVSHVRRKNPYFDGKVTVFIEQYHSFDSAQNARISSSSGFQIMLT